MIDAAYVQRLARYNRWQNDNLYGAADRLSDDERRRERGAFFSSIHGTLSHLLWGDCTWMNRFSDVPKPDVGIVGSKTLYPDWDGLKRERSAIDDKIVRWSDGVDPGWLSSDYTWFSNAAQRDVSKPMWTLVTHFFNHQTHHRGQVHAMLTQAGGKPGDTDLFLMPE
jgi:uncharacterized damage-inducible protein DinB